jgi:oligoendopeptidase F
MASENTCLPFAEGVPMPFPELDPMDWRTIQPHVDALLAAELTPATADAWLQQWSDLASVLYEAQMRINRKVTENTADEEADRQFLVFVELLRRFRAEASIYRAENVPILSELLKLGNQFDKVEGGLSIVWNGATETIPQARLHWQSQDRTERETSWRLVMAAHAAQGEKLNELYLQMLAQRRQVARNAGLFDYRAYKWQELARFDYTPADCVTFHDAIEHQVVPLARKIYAEQANRLGLGTLRPWDTDVDPNGEPLRPFKEVADLEEGCNRIFNQVDPELAAYFALMRDGFLDLPSRANKAGGGYCEAFPVTGKPFIFMNAVGTHDDVQTLLHEGGHAFHYMESRRNPLWWNQNGPMEFCEVASMGMELLSAPYLASDRGGFYSEADAARAYGDHLRGIVTFLPYMAVVDAFQHWIYVDAPEGVTAVDLDAKWCELWDRFMIGIDYAGLQAEKETGWHRKQHIFTDPFYYIEYGLAQLGALQVWRNALKDQPKAVANYRNALALGGTRGLAQLFTAAGGHFAFDRRTVGELIALVEEQLGLLTDKIHD